MPNAAPTNILDLILGQENPTDEGWIVSTVSLLTAIEEEKLLGRDTEWLKVTFGAGPETP